MISPTERLPQAIAFNYFDRYCIQVNCLVDLGNLVLNRLDEVE